MVKKKETLKDFFAKHIRPRWKQISAIGVLAALMTTGGVGLSNKIKKNAILRDVAEMERAYGWLSALPERSPLWSATSIKGLEKELSKLTHEEAKDYFKFIQTFHSVFLKFDIDWYEPDRARFNPNRDPLKHIKEVEDYLRPPKSAYEKAARDPHSLWVVQIREKQWDLWKIMKPQILAGKSPRERFENARMFATSMQPLSVESCSISLNSSGNYNRRTSRVY